MFESMPQRRSTDGAHPRAVETVVALPEPTGRELIERLLAAGPSGRGGMLLEQIDLEALDDHDRVDVLRLWDRQRNWADGQVQRALVAVGGPAPRPEDRRDDWAREEVACALRLSTSTAGARLDVARQLCGRLAATGSLSILLCKSGG